MVDGQKESGTGMAIIWSKSMYSFHSKLNHFHSTDKIVIIKEIVWNPLLFELDHDRQNLVLCH